MKKLLSGLVIALVGLSSVGQAAMIDDAVSWLYTNGYTIFSNTRDYQPNNYMRRDEAAKFFVKVAEGLGKTDYVKSASECTFSDLNDGHADLKDIVVKSCRMGIFQGHEGTFMPTDTLTNSQALAVLLRITSGYESETGVSYWADNYYTKAQSLGWLSLFPVLNTKEGLGTRGTVAQLVYMIYNSGNENDSSSGDGPVSQTDIVYKNTEYGFTLNLPSSWAGYEVTQDDYNIFVLINGEIVLDIHPVGKSEGEILNGLLLGENSKYKFLHYGGYISNNKDTILKLKDIENILKTFKLL